MTKLYQDIARTLDSLQTLQRCRAHPAIAGHEARLAQLINELPSGSGWDNGTKLDHDTSTPNKLVFYGSYHHMDDIGTYDGWTEHTIVVRPSLAFDIDVHVTGRNRNDIKEYLGETFQYALTQEAPPYVVTDPTS